MFIALNDEQKNLEVALECKKLFGKACISFIAPPDADKVEGLYPVTAAANDQQLERQAFNAHLIWEKNLCVNFAQIKKDFMEPYNHDASVATVAGLKYQLYAWGIDLDDKTFTDAVKDFMKLSTDAQRQADFMYAEHKRWVSEKICKGYTRRAVADCDDGKTADKVKKNHVCLVRCRADRFLRDKFSRADWDSCAVDELDELDRVSVAWHRHFAQKAANIRNNREVVYKQLVEIFAGIGNDLNEEKWAMQVDFNDWKICFEAMLNGEADSKILLRYKGLSQNFRARVQDADLLKKFDQFEQEIVKPLRLSMDYRDFKDEESHMFEAIPFILTYDSEKICLVIPFSDGENLTQLFANVASATVINPAQIVYLAFCRGGDDFQQLKNFLENIVAYMDRKNLQARVKVLVAHCGEDIAKIDGDGRIKFEFAKVNCRENPAPEIVKIMRHRLKELAESDSFVALELNDTAISNQLAGAGLYGEIPAYSFDSSAKKFVSVNNCEIFSYINTANVFLTANDLTALRGTFGWIKTQPALSDDDCLKLWERYCANRRCWKDLCTALKSCDTKEENLNVIGLNVPEKRAEDTLNLLKFLSDNRYIFKLNVDNFKVSFTYSREIIKDLLTNAGRIFEIFVYHELKKCIHYDDALLGFEPRWHQNNMIKNELDLLITKGFVTVLIECKATSSIGSEVYFKLRGLADKFAVNPTIIIVSDAKVKEFHRERGEDLKVKTILTLEELVKELALIPGLS